MATTKKQRATGPAIATLFMIIFFAWSFAYSLEVLRDTGTATPLSAKHTKTGAGESIAEVRFHLDAAPSASDILTISIDSSVNALYDTVLDTQDMNGITDHVYIPTFPQLLTGSSDQLFLNYLNDGSDNWGYEVIMK